jgi:hypothetical protein
MPETITLSEAALTLLQACVRGDNPQVDSTNIDGGVALAKVAFLWVPLALPVFRLG